MSANMYILQLCMYQMYVYVMHEHYETRMAERGGEKGGSRGRDRETLPPYFPSGGSGRRVRTAVRVSEKKTTRCTYLIFDDC